MYACAERLSDEDLDKLEGRIRGIRKWHRMDKAFASLRERLTEEQLDMLEAAINGDVSKYENTHP